MVQDINRPDVNGVAPKMQAVRDTIAAALAGTGMGWLSVTTDDNLLSSVTIHATVEVQSQWPGNIRQNAHGVLISILPTAGKRYYEAGQDVSVELHYKSFKIKAKMRKYTGPISKVATKIREYLEAVKAEVAAPTAAL